MTDYRQAFIQGNLSQALSLVEQALRADPQNPAFINDYGVILYRLEQYENAHAAFEDALRLCPGNPEILDHLAKTSVELKRFHPGRIAVFCGADGPSFFEPIYQELKQYFDIRFFEGDNLTDVERLMDTSDISWFEWATNFPALALKNRPKCKTIVRLHRYEAYVGWCAQINWDNVDTLITVGNPWVLKQIKTQVPDIENRLDHRVIPNGVNLDKFTFANRKKGKNLAFVANLREVKNPALLLQCMAALVKKDPQYRLFMAGKVQDPVLEQYLQHMIPQLNLAGNVFFEGWQEDIESWLADKHFIVSTSSIESQGMGILEGMARGLKPIIHNYPGAEDVFSPEFLFDTIDDFTAQVCDPPYNSAAYRSFVERKYPLDSTLTAVLETVSRLLLSALAPVSNNYTYQL